MMNDVLNGLFELIGALLICLHCRRLMADKKVAGVSPWPFVFFTTWGAWNLYYYPSVDCWWSFWGGTAVFTVNMFYCFLLWKYRNK